MAFSSIGSATFSLNRLLIERTRNRRLAHGLTLFKRVFDSEMAIPGSVLPQPSLCLSISFKRLTVSLLWDRISLQWQ